jgi:radical SAM-linked protein
VVGVAEGGFRLRIDFQKRDRLRFLSHLELARALERTVRRAQLPYAVSKGFNAHMRFAPGPALPVGTAGLDEHFDVWLDEYLNPRMALERLRSASVDGLPITAVSYVDPKAKGLQATHVHEEYEVVLDPGTLSAAEASSRLEVLVNVGTLTVMRKDKEKSYDLTRIVEEALEVREMAGRLVIVLRLRALEQGSLRPEVLIRAALGDGFDWTLLSITRTRLYEDRDSSQPAQPAAGLPKRTRLHDDSDGKRV